MKAETKIRLHILKEALKTGVVTKKYPFKPVEVPEGFRGKPTIDVEKCIGCGACVNVCPPNALNIEVNPKKSVKKIILFLGRCIFCGRCQDVCPTKAIKLTREFELSTLTMDDLYQVVELKMARCEICGKPYATVRQILYIAKNVPKEQRSLLLLCDECKCRVSAKHVSYARW